MSARHARPEVDLTLRARYFLLRVHQLADAEHEEQFYTRPNAVADWFTGTEWVPVFDNDQGSIPIRAYSQGAGIDHPRVDPVQAMWTPDGIKVLDTLVFHTGFGNPLRSPGVLSMLTPQAGGIGDGVPYHYYVDDNGKLAKLQRLLEKLQPLIDTFALAELAPPIVVDSAPALAAGRNEPRWKLYRLPSWEPVYDSATSDMHPDDFLRTSRWRELAAVCEHPIWGRRRPQLWSQVSRRRIERTGLWRRIDELNQLTNRPSLYMPKNGSVFTPPWRDR